MKTFLRLFVFLLGTAPFLVFFNNCSGGFSADSGSQSSGSQLGGPSLPDPNPDSKWPQSPPNPTGKLSVPLEVKEVAGTGAESYPITAVVPLPVGAYQDTSNFRIVNEAGNTIPAQFEVMNRWWGKDNSLRNVMVHFQPTVGAFTTAGTGITKYFFKDDGSNAPPEKSVSVTEAASDISITTGVTSFKIEKSPLKILTPAGELKAIFTGKNPDDIQESFNRPDIKIEVEEKGPLRAVVKLSSVTVFTDADHHRHGWAVRLYAYAGQPYLKVDYQLQNSDKKVKFSAALYFESLNLEIDTGKPATPASVRAELVDADFSSKPLGLMKAPGVNAIIRNFYQTWPNGLSVDASGKLKVELWPEWSAQYWEAQMNPTGLYWLEDMQHSYKEVLFDFSSSRTEDQLISLAKTFQFHPVATLPTSWYADTRATLDMGGLMPTREKTSTSDIRRPIYADSSYKAETDKEGIYRTYRFGWLNFGLDVDRKIATSMTGGVPYYQSSLLVTEDPADFYDAENRAVGEINIRPEWMADFKFATDNTLLKLTENPYSGGVWRAFDGHGLPTMAVPYISGTGRVANARDDEHGWFYPVEYGYAVSGNLWVKDWYKFIAEFRKIRLNQKDPWPDMSSRAIGHSLSHAMQAYRVTGDPEILTLFKNYITAYLIPRLDPNTGINTSNVTDAGEKQEAPFQGAYMLRSLASYNEELPADDPNVLKIFADYSQWNKNIGNYGYYTGIAASTTPGSSSGTSGVLAEMIAWYMLKSGDMTALDHMKMYYSTGIPAGVGAKPYDAFNPNWSGHGFINRFTPWVMK